jgi:hypothetical protein
MRNTSGWVLALAAVTFTGALAIFGSSLLEAVGLEAAPAPETPATLEDPAETLGPGVAQGLPGSVPGVEVVGEPGLSTTHRPVTSGEILRAVSQDPFQPDRTAPAERYRLPTETDARFVATERDDRRRGPELRVVGSAVVGDLGLALVQVGDSFPVAVQVGETVGEYLLTAVDEESATLVWDAEILVLAVMEPLEGRPTEERSQRGNVIIRGPDGQALQGRVQELLRGMQFQQFQRGRGGRGGGGGGGNLP